MRVGPDVVLLGPQRVCRVEIVEVGDQPGGVVDAAANVAHHAVEPGAAVPAAHIAHGVLAADTTPVREGRARNHHWPHHIGAHASGHHGVPAGLTVSEHEGLAEGLGVQLSDLLDEDGICASDVLNPLSLHGRSRKAREVDWVPGLECLADLAHLLEAANPWSLPGARIDDEDGALSVVDLHSLRRDDAQKRVVDRTRQLVAAHHQLAVVDQDRRCLVRQHLLALVAALAQDVQK